MSVRLETLVDALPTAAVYGPTDRDVAGLMERLRATCRDGNTVVVVSHRPEVLRGADKLVEVGPGAGGSGGTIVASGAAEDVLAGDGPTARALRNCADHDGINDSFEDIQYHAIIVGVRAFGYC